MVELWGIRRMSYSGTPKITVLSGPDHGSARANRWLYLGLSGGVLTALLLGGGLKLWQHHRANQNAASGDTTTAKAADPDAAAAQLTNDGQTADFASPFLAASPALAPSLTLAEPSLLQSTPSQNRVPTVAAGRPDPFAPLVASLRSPARPSPMPVAAPPPPPMATVPMAQAPTQPLPTVPVAATQSLPPLPTVTIPSLPVPPIPGGLPIAEGMDMTMATPNAALLSAVDQVAVNGVVQIGQQVHVIVTEPGSPSGRRVTQGDTVAGGRVRIKAIDLSSPDPTVVLTYNGQDYYRTVGSGAF